MIRHPTAQELIEATREHLESKVLPALTDPQLRFQTLVATHVLGVVARELAQGNEQRWHQWEALTAFLGHTEPRPADETALQQRLDALQGELCAAIQAGHYQDDAQALQALLKAQVEDALALWNPEFLARVHASKGPAGT